MPTEEVFANWTTQIETTTPSGGHFNVENLYDPSASRLWRLYLDAFKLLPVNKRLWVISAGLGLVRGEDPAPTLGYSATFTTQSPDFVEHPREWWNLLTKWHPRSFAHERAIHDLYSQLQDGHSLIIACGGSYYDAISDDLSQIRLNDGRRLVLAGTEVAIACVPPHLQKCAIAFPYHTPKVTASGQVAMQLVERFVQEKA
jgi:hypothetical protein